MRLNELYNIYNKLYKIYVIASRKKDIRPFQMDKFKIEGKKVIVWTKDGKKLGFLIRPSKGYRKHYTGYCPDRKTYIIYTKYYDIIKKCRNEKELPGNVIVTTGHELTHLGEIRVLSPAYSLGRFIIDFITEVLDMPKQEIENLFGLLLLDNIIEDLISCVLLKNENFNKHYSEEDVEEVMKTHQMIYQSYEFLKRNFLDALGIEEIINDLLNLGGIYEKKILNNVEKWIELDIFERLRLVGFIYFAYDLKLSSRIFNALRSHNYQLPCVYQPHIFTWIFDEHFKKNKDNEINKILNTIIKKNKKIKIKCRIFKYSYYSLADLLFKRWAMISDKASAEKDPIWKIRWELEFDRVLSGDHVWAPYLMLLTFLKEADLPTDKYNDIVELCGKKYGEYGPRLIPTPCIRIKSPLHVRFKHELYKMYGFYKICRDLLTYKLNKSTLKNLNHS